jgi:uncharacterized protein YndB with AHSA1/START domain
MKWLTIMVAAFAGIIVLVVVVGALLPRDHVASMRARIGATPEVVWRAITDVEQQPAWRPGVQRIELLPAIDGKTAWREHSTNGPIAMVIDRAEAPTRVVTRIADDKLPFGGTWEYVIAADGDGTSMVTITERGSVHHPVFRFFSRFVFGHTATMDAYLRALSRKFGAEATPTVVATSI